MTLREEFAIRIYCSILGGSQFQSLYAEWYDSPLDTFDDLADCTIECAMAASLAVNATLMADDLISTMKDIEVCE